jgi:hypothetical protein
MCVRMWVGVGVWVCVCGWVCGCACVGVRVWVCQTFLTVDIGAVPAVLAPTLEAVMPLTRVPTLTTWTADSGTVFARMTEQCTVRAGCPVTRVCTGGWVVAGGRAGGGGGGRARGMSAS